jgi:hypothetical protein
VVKITEKPVQRASGHTFYLSRHQNALDLVESVGRHLDDSGFEDDPYNPHGDPLFKITIIVEQV